MDVTDDGNVGNTDDSSSDDSNHSMPPKRKGPKRSVVQVKSHWITNTMHTLILSKNSQTFWLYGYFLFPQFQQPKKYNYEDASDDGDDDDTSISDDDDDY